MSLKEELDKIIYTEQRYNEGRGRRPTASGNTMKNQLDEVRPLLTEFADAVDEEYVSIRITDTRVVIDVGDTRSDTDRFEIDGRWELAPNPEVRFLAEPGAEVFRPKPSFVVWKTLYLRPLAEPDNMSWDRMEFDSGIEAFQFVFQDVAKQIAHLVRLKEATGKAREASSEAG